VLSRVGADGLPGVQEWCVGVCLWVARGIWVWVVFPRKPKTVSEVARVSACEKRVGASDGGSRVRGGLLSGCPDVGGGLLSGCPDMMLCNNTVADTAKQKTRKMRRRSRVCHSAVYVTGV
jgi:hypothetical protein